MSRDDGFTVADVDSAYFDDAKMRDLWQRIRDGNRMARAVVLHAATLLASWRHGERVTVGQASPMWMPLDDEIVADLKAVRLLDRAGKIPLTPWNQWFGAAHERREVRRAAGRTGGLASGKQRSTDAEATVQQPSSEREPDRPSVPTVRPSGSTGRPSTRATREGRHGLKALTGEDAIKALDAEFAAERISAQEYRERRKALGAA